MASFESSLGIYVTPSQNSLLQLTISLHDWANIRILVIGATDTLISRSLLMACSYGALLTRSCTSLGEIPSNSAIAASPSGV